MANTFKFGNKNWAVKKDYVLAYNDENDNFKPLPFDFTRDSTATYVDSDGLIKTAQKGIARIDYLDNTDGHLLLEPSRTNIITYSDDFSDSSWAKSDCTITSNNSISPDGTQNADKLNFTTSSGYIVRTTSFTSGQKYTMSFYAKTESGTLDFTYGNMDYSTISGTATTEWQRFEITQTLPTATRYPKIGVTEVGSLLLWGWQVEQGSYATSYIPTEGSSVTRSTETCKGAGNSDSFNSIEGSLFVNSYMLDTAAFKTAFRITDTSTSNGLWIYFRSDEKIQSVLRVSGTDQCGLITSSAVSVNQYHKVAFKYKANDFALWVNGNRGIN
jgi:hypothetical protein